MDDFDALEEGAACEDLRLVEKSLKHLVVQVSHFVGMLSGPWRYPLDRARENLMDKFVDTHGARL